MSATPLTRAEPESGVLENKFLIVALACQRATQLRAGARPHLDARGRNTCVAAVAEVMAGTVAYSVEA